MEKVLKQLEQINKRLDNLENDINEIKEKNSLKKENETVDNHSTETRSVIEKQQYSRKQPLKKYCYLYTSPQKETFSLWRMFFTT